MRSCGAPSKAQAETVARIAGDLRGVLAAPELRERLLRDSGAEAEADGPEAFAGLLAGERQKYSGPIREVGATLDSGDRRRGSSRALGGLLGGGR